MKKLLLAGLLFGIATAFAPLAASADVVAQMQKSVTTTSNPLDANAQMRDPSSYGSPSAGRMRTGMRGRSMYRSRMMMRRGMMRPGMMRGNRTMMRRSMRDPSKFGGSQARPVRR